MLQEKFLSKRSITENAGLITELYNNLNYYKESMDLIFTEYKKEYKDKIMQYPNLQEEYICELNASIRNMRLMIGTYLHYQKNELYTEIKPQNDTSDTVKTFKICNIPDIEKLILNISLLYDNETNTPTREETRQAVHKNAIEQILKEKADIPDELKKMILEKPLGIVGLNDPLMNPINDKFLLSTPCLKHLSETFFIEHITKFGDLFGYKPDDALDPLLQLTLKYLGDEAYTRISNIQDCTYNTVECLKPIPQEARPGLLEFTRLSLRFPSQDNVRFELN